MRTQYGWDLQPQELRGHFQGGFRPSLPPLTLESILEGSQSLGGPQTLSHTLRQVSSAGNTARTGLGGQWLGQSFPATSLFAPQGCPSRSRQDWWQQVPAFQRGPGWPGPREGTERAC